MGIEVLKGTPVMLVSRTRFHFHCETQTLFLADHQIQDPQLIQQAPSLPVGREGLETPNLQMVVSTPSSVLPHEILY